MAKWEDYTIGNTNVLKNKLGITEQEELDKVETKMVVSKLALLYVNGMKGNFDEEHLCRIHKFLFEDLYDFAGKYREVDIYKVTSFSHHEEIKEQLKQFFEQMNNIEFSNDNKFEIASYIAKYYLGLIQIHPFREGNGRTTREFIRQLVLAKFPNYELDYTKIDKENFKIGVIEYRHYPSLLTYEIYNGLVENQKGLRFGHR